MEVMKLPTVVVDNGHGGTVITIEEDDILSGEVILMQRYYRQSDNYLVEETRFARLIDDVCRMTTHEFYPGEPMIGNIIMKQRTMFALGYKKLKNSNGTLMRDKDGIPIWGRTYYSEDVEDKDELIIDSIGE